MSESELTSAVAFFIYDFAKNTWSKQQSFLQIDDELNSRNVALFFRASGYICGLDTQEDVPMMW